MPWIDVPSMPGAERAAKAYARAQDADRGWYSIRNAASPEQAELLLYDEVGGWFGATADQFVDDLADITAPSILLRINSPGGSVFEGVAIANAIRNHPANVTVQVDGIAASIASVIAMAGDRIVMAPNSMMMIHDASGMCLGDAAEMAKMAQVLDTISDNIAGAYAERTGGTVEDWRTTMRAETWYKAQDAVDAGLADEVMPARKPAADSHDGMSARFDLAAYGYAGPPRPKPAPPVAKTEPAQPTEPAVSTLVISIADILDDDMVARLRAAVAGHQPTASTVRPDETTDAIVHQKPPEPDPWATSVAHLTQPTPDPWAASIAHLTIPASPAATDA